MRDTGTKHRFRIEHEPSVTSTNDLVRSRADMNEPEGLVLRADEQIAGRGRHGRVWNSPRGNLYASILLRPAVRLADASTLSLVTALSLVEALECQLGQARRLNTKWPNDVLIDRRKIAGILLEGAADNEARTAWIIIGMGVNLETAPPLPRATSVREAFGQTLAPAAVLDAFLESFEARLQVWEQGGFAPLREAWLDRAGGLGGRVTLRRGEESIEGRFADLGRDGSVLIENQAGCLERFTTGELFFPD